MKTRTIATLVAFLGAGIPAIAQQMTGRTTAS